MLNKTPKRNPLCFLDEACSASGKSKNERNFNSEGGSKMASNRNKRKGLRFRKPFQYPVPSGLIIGSWGI
ncbi:hypothetical protein KAX02_05770 [candidate division WOR-3 bacterium]|nr:hypothetical protein [candidate division WOR-3 bacterium]